MRSRASSLCETELQRARILDAMVDVVGERGFAGSSVAMVIKRAGVSSRTFYALFDGLQDCFLTVMDEESDRAGALVTDAFGRAGSWQEGLRAALASLLVLLDSEPLLARVCLVEVLAAGSWALERRERNISRLTALIVSAWTVPDGWQPPPLAAEGVMASVLGILQGQVVSGKPEPQISLLGPLLGIIMRPYLPHSDVAREIERGRKLAVEIQKGQRQWPLDGMARSFVKSSATARGPRGGRAGECLLFLAHSPDSSNHEVATGIGVAHQSQISRLLSQLLSEGLVTRHSEGAGKRNAWRLTQRGEHEARAVGCR